MFKSDPQKRLLPLFFAVGSRPLDLWTVNPGPGGTARLVEDPEIRSRTLELSSTNISTCHMKCPGAGKWLGIRMPYLVFVLKNMSRYFAFEVTILDSDGVKRRFRFANFQSKQSVGHFGATAPLALTPGWNQIMMNLDDYTNRVFGTSYAETGSIQINANTRLRNVYFAGELLDDQELPRDYKIYHPSSRVRGGDLGKAPPKDHKSGHPKQKKKKGAAFGGGAPPNSPRRKS